MTSNLLPSEFWYFGLRYVVQVTNMVPITLSDGNSSTSFELAYGTKSDWRNFSFYFLLHTSSDLGTVTSIRDRHIAKQLRASVLEMTQNPTARFSTYLILIPLSDLSMSLSILHHHWSHVLIPLMTTASNSTYLLQTTLLFFLQSLISTQKYMHNLPQLTNSTPQPLLMYHSADPTCSSYTIRIRMTLNKSIASVSTTSVQRIRLLHPGNLHPSLAHH